MGKLLRLLIFDVKEILATKCLVSMLVIKQELCLLWIELLYEL